MTWRLLILAAGQGTRMGSDLAKVLHPLCGQTLLSHLLTTASRLSAERIGVVVGFQQEQVRSAHREWQVDYILQEPQRGTGHAVQQAEEFLSGHEGGTLILYGDVPLLRRSTLLELMEEHVHAGNAVTVLTARVDEPAGYGRIIRGMDGRLEAIVEDKDLTPDQRGVDEINSGIYAFETSPLLTALRHLKDDNRQRELYLTDTIHLLRHQGLKVGTCSLPDPMEISGINTPAQLARAAAELERRRRNGTEDCTICALAGRGAGFPVLLSREHAFLAISGRPYNSGQLAAHPARHMQRHAELTDSERRDLWELGQAAASLVGELYQPQGMNLGYSVGRPGEHLALQVIPRWVGDTNFMPILAETTLLPESPMRTFLRMRDLLARKEQGR